MNGGARVKPHNRAALTLDQIRAAALQERWRFDGKEAGILRIPAIRFLTSG